MMSSTDQGRIRFTVPETTSGNAPTPETSNGFPRLLTSAATSQNPSEREGTITKSARATLCNRSFLSNP